MSGGYMAGWVNVLESWLPLLEFSARIQIIWIGTFVVTLLFQSSTFLFISVSKGGQGLCHRFAPAVSCQEMKLKEQGSLPS